MSDYLISCNKVYGLLKSSSESFKREALLIDEAKCYLINYKNLDDYEYDGAYTYETGSGYCLVDSELVINLEIEEGMITNYSFN